MKPKISLTLRIFFIMAAFVFMLLILLYMLQINLLPAYFQQQILDHVQETRPRINGIIEDMEANIAYEDQLSRLRQSSADYNVCAYVYDDDAILRLEINSMGSLCYLNSVINPSLESYVQSSTLMGYYIDMVTHQESSEIYFQVQPNADVARQLFLGYEFMVDGQRFYGFINTPYELVDSTITILRDQFFYISVIVFVLAMLVALIISRGLSMPLVRMSQQALRLGKGDKDIAFEGGSIREVDHLAQALNYATDEMQKND
ncbi:MAG TPA: cell wall metabolism sensor histidine kinase WalK, partial [Erysipelothrix sp.]|nr:cell wall metabolism sensor histidine kinase WalK [Erysipelothrix sp.]